MDIFLGILSIVMFFMAGWQMPGAIQEWKTNIAKIKARKSK